MTVTVIVFVLAVSHLENRKANRIEVLHAFLKAHYAMLARLESRNVLAQEADSDLRPGIFDAPEDEHPLADSFDKS